MADKIIHTGDGGGNTAVGLISGIVLAAVLVIGGLFFFGGFGGKAPAPDATVSVDVNGR
jgi:hypothetical protein